jgi:RNA polymerase nonessential primary-like sigma factor
MSNITPKSSRTSSSNDLVKLYLREIGKFPLLKHEEEVLYGKQVQQKMALLEIHKQLAGSLDRIPTLIEWQNAANLEPAQLDRLLKQGERAKQKMINSNLRLVVAVAKRFQHRGLEFLDLIQEGTLGLERGVEKFDSTKGYRFSTYAYWWIRQGITRAIAEKGRTIRLPLHIIEKLNKIKKTQRQLAEQSGCTPSITDIAAAIALPANAVREYLRLNRGTMSLDIKVGEESNTELHELLPASTLTPETYADTQILQQEISEILLTSLTPREREVLMLRHGFESGHEVSLAKIGKQLNLSRERVRQIEQKAERKVKKALLLRSQDGDKHSIFSLIPAFDQGC